MNAPSHILTQLDERLRLPLERLIACAAVADGFQTGLLVVAEAVVKDVIVLLEEQSDLADIDADVAIAVVVMPLPRLLPVAPVAAVGGQRRTASAGAVSMCVWRAGRSQRTFPRTGATRAAGTPRACSPSGRRALPSRCTAAVCQQPAPARRVQGSGMARCRAVLC